MNANYYEAVRLLSMAHHYTYGDGGDSVTGGALATEAQAYATLALVDAIQQTSVDPWAVGATPDTTDADDGDEEQLTNADVMSSEELYEMDRDAEFAQDAADDERQADEDAEDGR